MIEPVTPETHKMKIKRELCEKYLRQRGHANSQTKRHWYLFKATKYANQYKQLAAER